MIKFTPALILLSLISIPAMSQPRTIQVPVICVTKPEMSKVLDDFEEKPLMTMMTVREVEGRAIETKSVIFVNSNTRTWTLVEQIGDYFCAISAGSGAAPYID